jgi:MoaA/NifB/PqqE/SkfB family radical SAM enzyme
MINLLKHIHLNSPDRIERLAVVALMPHSACNCRCVMCDIWKANANKQELTREDLLPHIASFRKFEVNAVILSGGEALMHSNLWRLCELLKEVPVKISLLSTGLLLKPHASEVIRWCDDVIVSLDGNREAHEAIRNVPRAYDRLAEGVAALKELDPKFRVSARCVIQRRNCFALPDIIAAAHEIGVDQISFLAVDVATTAFNRPTPWRNERIADVALSSMRADFGAFWKRPSCATLRLASGLSRRLRRRCASCLVFAAITAWATSRRTTVMRPGSPL